VTTEVGCFKKVCHGHVITIGNDTPWNMLIDNRIIQLHYAKSDYNARRKLIVLIKLFAVFEDTGNGDDAPDAITSKRTFLSKALPSPSCRKMR
jgi:hypothetical protein